MPPPPSRASLRGTASSRRRGDVQRSGGPLRRSALIIEAAMADSTASSARPENLITQGRQLSEAAFGFLLASPALIVLLGIVGYPVAYAFVSSFQHFRIMDPNNIYF